MNGFRFIRSDGKYGVPISVTNSDDRNSEAYGQSCLNNVFNVNDSPGGDNLDHWCAWDTTILTLDFGKKESFKEYKFVPYPTPCTNDPQGWKILGSHDNSNWIEIISEDHDCPLPNLSDWNTYLLPSTGGGSTGGNSGGNY